MVVSFFYHDVGQRFEVSNNNGFGKNQIFFLLQGANSIF
jgi:hypothetical protein